jgi:hypothetical protein
MHALNTRTGIHTYAHTQTRYAHAHHMQCCVFLHELHLHNICTHTNTHTHTGWHLAGSASGLWEERWPMALLVLLYMLQGIPMGLTLGAL